MKKITNRTQRIGAYVLATAMAASLSVTAIAAQPAETAEAPEEIEKTEAGAPPAAGPEPAEEAPSAGDGITQD